MAGGGGDGTGGCSHSLRRREGDTQGWSGGERGRENLTRALADLDARVAAGTGAADTAEGYRSMPFASPGKVICPFQPQYDRYMNVLPYEHSRVKISPSEANRAGYINACHVRSDRSDPADFEYLAAQGPIEETTNDFWTMVCEHKVTAVVMLCDLVEDMIPKCAQYFPLAAGERFETRDFVITAVHVDLGFCPGLEHRVLEIERRGQRAADGAAKKSVDHFRYSDWPDHGVPDTHDSMVEMSRVIRTYHPRSKVVVHCSAGIGRTGTFCLIDIILRRVAAGLGSPGDHGGSRASLDPLEVLRELRACRLGMVQTIEQFAFAVHAIRKALASALL